MASARALLASGAGLSLPRLATAFSTMPSAGPSFAARSNSTVSTPALVRWAAICAPITPAPSTAARRTSNLSDMLCNPLHEKKKFDRSAFEAGGGEADQFACAAFAMGGLADAIGALDQAEVGHRVSQCAAEEVQPPIQFFLAQ